MQSRTAYDQYKQDSSRVVQWLVKTSNAILLNNPQHDGLPPSDDAREGKLTVNRTGEVRVNEIVAMSRLVSRYVNRVPSAIFKVFQSAIDLRTSFYNHFSGMEAMNPRLTKSNDSHKHFIEVLQSSFDILGGTDWASRMAEGVDVSDEGLEFNFVNRFDSLHVDSGESGGEEDDKKLEATTNVKRHRKAKPKSGKKGKGKKRSKQPRAPEAPEDLPLESYKIIQDEDGALADYLMAVSGLIQEWIDLRVFVQNLWEEVAYNGLHSAVAGALSNMAVTAVKNLESAIWLEFPGHDSYYSVLDIITQGDISRAKSMFPLTVWDPTNSKRVDGVAIDAEEQLMLNTYRDLVDFAVDYQNNRNGKPTKRMQKQLAGWDPSMNLFRASPEERLLWRRKYTINWLFDLVNVFTDIVVRHPEQQQRLEDIDWSSHGHWSKTRRMYGLCDFAGFVSTLAMQKPGTDIRHRIRPSHVFQLQCIVDSMTAAHGWTTGFSQGHVLQPPALKFKATRDIDMLEGRRAQWEGLPFRGAFRQADHPESRRSRGAP